MWSRPSEEYTHDLKTLYVKFSSFIFITYTPLHLLIDAIQRLPNYEAPKNILTPLGTRHDCSRNFVHIWRNPSCLPIWWLTVSLDAIFAWVVQHELLTLTFTRKRKEKWRRLSVAKTVLYHPCFIFFCKERDFTYTTWAFRTIESFKVYKQTSVWDLYVYNWFKHSICAPLSKPDCDRV